MTPRRRALTLLAVIAGLGLALADAGFALPQAHQALVQRFGRLVSVDAAPGLGVKWPFIDSVTFYDSRVQALAPPTELIILGDQKRVEIDTYTLFRITDPARFAETVQSLAQARAQLTQIVGTSLRRVLGRVMLPALLSAERAAIIDAIRREVAENVRPLGLTVVDVRIRRADLPLETSQAIYDRMTSERQREAKELRAQGFEWAQEITARADAERTVLLAEAERTARITRSAGEAEADRLVAAAASSDPRFFAFYRAMQTYRGAMAKAAPTIMLAPDSALLRYFNEALPSVATASGKAAGDSDHGR
ncbi:MAG: protease modulator HflC [Acidibrevibacterium sp.]|uniref:protease modulator HflC n=1 Tax=Acidibrevibacterium sp. TaxID=2606776 RepID=UPI003D03DBBE